MRRTRAFSDVSIAESCINSQKKKKALINHKIGGILILNNRVTQEQIDVLSENIRSKFQDNFSTENLTEVIEYMYILIQDSIQLNDAELKTLLIELLGSFIDETHIFNDADYVKLYRPILRDIAPAIIDIIGKNILNTQVKTNVQSRKKKCAIM